VCCGLTCAKIQRRVVSRGETIGGCGFKLSRSENTRDSNTRTNAHRTVIKDRSQKRTKRRKPLVPVNGASQKKSHRSGAGQGAVASSRLSPVRGGGGKIDLRGGKGEGIENQSGGKKKKTRRSLDSRRQKSRVELSLGGAKRSVTVI